MDGHALTRVSMNCKELLAFFKQAEHKNSEWHPCDRVSGSTAKMLSFGASTQLLIAATSSTPVIAAISTSLFSAGSNKLKTHAEPISLFTNVAFDQRTAIYKINSHLTAFLNDCLRNGLTLYLNKLPFCLPGVRGLLKLFD